ncbi:hypothetical protein ECANGB1_2339 [Enterospora canceri]|uniref:Uncharacterized protein n=1 Tax=Enterospora canceri TaxID=1081671 RepID=A0A1Y1S9E1_9MICR|nr:hypothetical protein ECANGB1_2339 [Enterospora canceri]
MDGKPMGVDKIGMYKEHAVVAEVLDLLTMETFYVELGTDSLVESDLLGINVAETSELPEITHVKILSTSNPLFRENDMILGVEDVHSDDLVEEITSEESKTLLVLRNHKILRIETDGSKLHCEIGVGLLYRPIIGKEIYNEEYNGKVKRKYRNSINETENRNVTSQVERKEEENKVAQVKEKKLGRSNIKYDDRFDEIVKKEEEYVQGVKKEEETVAKLVNDEFICRRDYAEEGVLTDEAFARRKQKQEKVEPEDGEQEPTVGNQRVFGDLNNQSSSDIFENTKKEEKDCIHFSDCDCEERKKKNSADPSNFLSESDEGGYFK